MVIFYECGVYGYGAMGAGLVMLLLSLWALHRRAKALLMFRLAIWCLLPILIGYAGAVVSQRLLAERLTHGQSADMSLLRTRWYSVYVGLIGAAPGMAVALWGLARALGRRRHADRP